VSSHDGKLSSILQAHFGQIQILMAVVEYRTKLHKLRRVSPYQYPPASVTRPQHFLPFTGCVYYVACKAGPSERLRVGNVEKLSWFPVMRPVMSLLCVFLHADTFHIPVWVVPGTILFPQQPDSSVIMIGPGTGCAPFRAYVEERMAQGASGKLMSHSCPRLRCY